MKINTAKQKMLKGEPAFGFPLGLGSAEVAGVLASTGIDFILCDTQHGSWGPDSTIKALAYMAAGTATPMARVAANNYTMIGRLLDEGMMGIVVPMVHTPADARAAAAAVRFPPIGERSWGWARAGQYGADYPEWIDEQVFLAVQIESALAVENAEAILATPGVDGCWIGPADLALTLGIRPKDMYQREEHAQALEKVLAACKNTGKIPGIAAGPVEGAVKRAQQGFRFLTAGSDGTFLAEGAAAALKALGAWK